MKEIKLPRGVWYYEPEKQLGPEGGFGTVFLGKDSKDNELAIKKIKLDAEELAHRELDIADWMADYNYEHLIPIFDAGQDSESGSCFVVMAKAEHSLKDRIEKEGIVNDKEAAHILYEIVQGLIEMKNLVHRDLKPGNILFHEGKWKIADFGIARFVENATSQRTVKDCLTPDYAAPEQWGLQRCTNSTDIYALGCISYFILTGSPPFSGPTPEDFQHQHLNLSPPKLEGQNSKLSSLINMMLRKAPETRPSIDRIKKVLDESQKEVQAKDVKSGFDLLSDAGKVVAQIESEKEAELRLGMEENAKRAKIFSESIKILDEVISNLKDRVTASTPVAKLSDRNIKLGNAKITFEYGHQYSFVEKGIFENSKLDVVGVGKIELFQDKPQYQWGASLWFMKISESGDYRWYEASYFGSPYSSKRYIYEPFAITNLSDADVAHSRTIGNYQIAYGPFPIDGEDIDSFCERWANLLARASQGSIQHPSRLPLPDDYFVRFK